jgi:murein DD-endopeptidase MepM/ murein hydrolase activator NlpD
MTQHTRTVLQVAHANQISQANQMANQIRQAAQATSSAKVADLANAEAQPQSCTPPITRAAMPKGSRRALSALALLLLALATALALGLPAGSAQAAEPKCMLHQFLKGKCKIGQPQEEPKEAAKSESKKKPEKKSKSKSETPEAAPEAASGPAQEAKTNWVFTDLAKSGPNDIIVLPDHATMQEWHKQSYAENAYRNPYKRKRSELPSYPQRPWNNRLPFFKDPSMGVMTSDFGWRNLNGLDFHGGMDVKAPVRTPVYSHVSGEIIKIFHGRGTNVGIILQTDDVQHLFWHMTPLRKYQKGQRIEAGQMIGKLAPWGYQTHLHYAIFVVGPTGTDAKRDDKNAIDPEYVLDRLEQDAQAPEAARVWRSSQQLPFEQQLDDTGDGGAKAEALASLPEAWGVVLP